MGRGLVPFAFLLAIGCNGSSGSSGPSDSQPDCAGGLQRCGDRCVDVGTDLLNCGSCGSVCPGPYDSCSSGQCHIGPTCGSDAPACITEHGEGSCCAGVCVGNPDMVMCMPACTSNSECGTQACCTPYGGKATCLPQPATGCPCTTSDDCLAGQACAPATNGSGDPVGPMACKPNDGALYHGCNGATTCTEGCCVADAHGNQFCATACADSTNCGAAHCDPYDFSHGTCAGPIACGL